MTRTTTPIAGAICSRLIVCGVRGTTSIRRDYLSSPPSHPRPTNHARWRSRSHRSSYRRRRRASSLRWRIARSTGSVLESDRGRRPMLGIRARPLQLDRRYDPGLAFDRGQYSTRAGLIPHHHKRSSLRNRLWRARTVHQVTQCICHARLVRAVPAISSWPWSSTACADFSPRATHQNRPR